MRLIDADALMNKLNKKAEALHERCVKEQDIYFGAGMAAGVRGAIYHIGKAPTVDAVEVVRCKECTHWSNGDDTYGICYRCPNTRQMRYDDFCSYGERKDNVSL